MCTTNLAHQFEKIPVSVKVFSAEEAELQCSSRPNSLIDSSSDQSTHNECFSQLVSYIRKFANAFFERSLGPFKYFSLANQSTTFRFRSETNAENWPYTLFNNRFIGIAWGQTRWYKAIPIFSVMIFSPTVSSGSLLWNYSFVKQLPNAT